MQEVLAATVAGAERISRIVDDLRSFARREDEPAAACDVGSVVHDALRLTSRRLESLDEVSVHIEPRPAARPRRRTSPRAGAREPAAQTPATPWEASARRAAGARGLFYTTKGTRGTGLGLAVSRENLSRFGGTIDGGAGAMDGARFTIRLRASQ